MKNSHFDKKGADLVLNSTYFSPDSTGTNGYACIETPDSEYRVLLSFDNTVVSYCKYIRGAEDKPVSLDGRYPRALSELEDDITTQGGKCLYVISEINREMIFEGALTLCERWAENIDAVIGDIEKMGIRSTALIGSMASTIEKCFNGEIAYADEFKSRGLDITHDFGKYKAYVGFSDDEHIALVDHMRKNGASVAAYGIGDEHFGAMSHADLAISSDVVKYSSQKYKESVYEQLPQSGRDTNIRCSQKTRLLSKVLVHRANQLGGGLSAIDKAFKRAKGAYLSFSNSLLFYVVIMSIILPITAMTALTGTVFLNAIETVSLTAAAVILASNAFADTEPRHGFCAKSRSSSHYKLLRDNLVELIVRSSVASAFALTVKILDIFKVFGENASYSMSVFISIIIIAAIELFNFNITFNKRGAGKRRTWIWFLAVYATILGVCGIITQDIFARELFPNGIGTYEFILVPAYCILHTTALSVLYLIKRIRNQN